MDVVVNRGERDVNVLVMEKYRAGFGVGHESVLYEILDEVGSVIPLSSCGSISRWRKSNSTASSQRSKVSELVEATASSLKVTTLEGSAFNPFKKSSWPTPTVTCG